LVKNPNISLCLCLFILKSSNYNNQATANYKSDWQLSGAKITKYPVLCFSLMTLFNILSLEVKEKPAHQLIF